MSKRTEQASPLALEQVSWPATLASYGAGEIDCSMDHADFRKEREGDAKE